MSTNAEKPQITVSDRAARGTGEPHLAEKIYNKLCMDLQDGLYAPGAKLILRDVAAEFGASLTPVRDALNRLVGERVLTMGSNRTISVPVPLAAEVREIRRIRMELEGFAAAEAAEKGSAIEFEDIAIDAKAFVLARRNGDSRRMLEANRDFHFKVYSAARMPFLLEIIKGLWLRNGPLQYLLSQSTDAHLERSDDHHDAVLRALRERDAVAAKQGIRDDIDYATNEIILALVELKIRPGA